AKSLTINGEAAVSGTAKAVTIPASGLITIAVTAEDGTTVRSYTIQVNRKADPALGDATLSALKVTPGTLSPVFDPAKNEYTVTVGQEVTTLQVTATTNNPNAKSLTMNGKKAVSGQAKAVTIPAGGLIAIGVTSEDFKSIKIYTIRVKRKPDPVSSDATLSALAVSPGTLTPVFDPAKAAYSVLVEKNATTLQVTATKRDPKAKSLTINGEAAVSGTAKAVTIPASGLITIAVTAEDGTTLRSYTIQVKRKADPALGDATLSALKVTPGTLSPVFDPAKNEYTVTVGQEVTTLQVTATTNNPNAKSLTMNGRKAVSGQAKAVLIPDGGLIAIGVTSEDFKTIKIYTIRVKRST
ncbi:cadherin-like beta sandwich domain-containing protein, partial [Paenibacillus mendelii]